MYFFTLWIHSSVVVTFFTKSKACLSKVKSATFMWCRPQYCYFDGLDNGENLCEESVSSLNYTTQYSANKDTLAGAWTAILRFRGSVQHNRSCRRFPPVGCSRLLENSIITPQRPLCKNASWVKFIGFHRSFPPLLPPRCMELLQQKFCLYTQ